MSGSTSDRREAEKPIALVGLRCSGKTSVGRALAARLRVEFVDLDERIVAMLEGLRAGTRAGEVLQQLGEARFRERESLALRDALAHDGLFVLATGGGVVERDDNCELLRSRTRAVWLRADVGELQRRMRLDPTPRPALTGADPIVEVPDLAQRRDPLYRELAALELETTGATPEGVARRIAEALTLGH